MLKFFTSLLIFLYSLSAMAQLRVSLESGLVFNQYNDVRVPNGEMEKGTLFSLTDDFEVKGTNPFFRFEAAYLIADKHMVELTAAPLTLEYEKQTNDTILFDGKIFGSPETTGRYEFNTYRISYRYRFVDQDKWTVDLGASVLIRDARIALEENDIGADDTDLGFVPLLSFEVNYQPETKVSFLLKGDALVGSQGRAEDIFAGILYPIQEEKFQLKAGYRFIEGGADVGQVYNFAYFHFANLALVYTP